MDGTHPDSILPVDQEVVCWLGAPHVDQTAWHLDRLYQIGSFFHYSQSSALWELNLCGRIRINKNLVQQILIDLRENHQQRIYMIFR